MILNHIFDIIIAEIVFNNLEENMMRQTTNKTKDLVYIALFAVMMAVCSYISIPTAIPFTMQTFAVFFAHNFLGGKKELFLFASICYLG